ncbi:MAG: hypothetical protein EOP22_16415 [Hyphomicrobiales bacterium]|nr:MAG: hypothetical protein EOP22_16415 [Hyphomicrobiales bacterium]
MEDHDEALGGGPRREVSAATIAGREARQLVVPTNRKLGEWQATSIKLETMAARLKAAGRHDPAIAEGAATLRQLVVAETVAFEAVVAGAPEPVQLHSRVGDTRHALRALAARLGAILADLGEMPAGR